MSRINVGGILLWTIKLDKMLVKDPAFEVIAQYFAFLLRISGESMSRISLLEHFLHIQSVASSKFGGCSADRVTVRSFDQAIVRVCGNRS